MKAALHQIVLRGTCSRKIYHFPGFSNALRQSARWGACNDKEGYNQMVLRQNSLIINRNSRALISIKGVRGLGKKWGDSSSRKAI